MQLQGTRRWCAGIDEAQNRGSSTSIDDSFADDSSITRPSPASRPPRGVRMLFGALRAAFLTCMWSQRTDRRVSGW